jgi:hypothetical protein
VRRRGRLPPEQRSSGWRSRSRRSSRIKWASVSEVSSGTVTGPLWHARSLSHRANVSSSSSPSSCSRTIPRPFGSVAVGAPPDRHARESPRFGPDPQRRSRPPARVRKRPTEGETDAFPRERGQVCWLDDVPAETSAALRRRPVPERPTMRQAAAFPRERGQGSWLDGVTAGTPSACGGACPRAAHSRTDCCGCDPASEQPE